MTVFKSGFVAIVGRPNVGKSTLLNCLIGQQISITADKPQTTRNNIKGILNGTDFQAVVIDTPGIHLPHNELHKRIVGYATQTIRDSDLVFFLTEPLLHKHSEISKGDAEIIDQFPTDLKNIVLVINKTDLYGPEEVMKTIDIYNKRFSFLETVPVSALKSKGIEILKSFLPRYLPEGVAYFDRDQFTDASERVIVGEFIREQIMRNCFQEIPYGAAVVVDSFKEGKQQIKIFATIFVERESHKRIVIGKQGSMLKKVGQLSRLKIERLVGAKVYLSLHVKVSKNWMNDPERLSDFGYSE